MISQELTTKDVKLFGSLHKPQFAQFFSLISVSNQSVSPSRCLLSNSQRHPARDQFLFKKLEMLEVTKRCPRILFYYLLHQQKTEIIRSTPFRWQPAFRTSLKSEKKMTLQIFFSANNSHFFNEIVLVL